MAFARNVLVPSTGLPAPLGVVPTLMGISCMSDIPRKIGVVCPCTTSCPIRVVDLPARGMLMANCVLTVSPSNVGFWPLVTSSSDEQAVKPTAPSAIALMKANLLSFFIINKVFISLWFLVILMGRLGDLGELGGWENWETFKLWDCWILRSSLFTLPPSLEGLGRLLHSSPLLGGVGEAFPGGVGEAS